MPQRIESALDAKGESTKKKKALSECELQILAQKVATRKAVAEALKLANLEKKVIVKYENHLVHSRLKSLGPPDKF
ncbi:hypothetical protein Glove_74g333 [Diversispora epigaea]|uniref:Uncharacterized protein n=1 Tax=Diversispora epigaea TaxID=1348612 RepID=A0A397JCT3_9GLOM|nr:hypothetical protein Glove_74g333 [Diversispora epigaea]